VKADREAGSAEATGDDGAAGAAGGVVESGAAGGEEDPFEPDPPCIEATS